MQRHVAFLHPNIWPTAHLPSMEHAFKDLGRLIVQVPQGPHNLTYHAGHDISSFEPRVSFGKLTWRMLLGGFVVGCQVGLLVAKQCDSLVHSRCPTYPPDRLHQMLTHSRCCKARLLHYFPLHENEDNDHDDQPPQEGDNRQAKDDVASW
jgi:hypothetical protein